MARQLKWICVDRFMKMCDSIPNWQCNHCCCCWQMGTEKESFIELTERIGRKTGGVSVYPFTSAKRGDEQPVAKIMVSRGCGILHLVPGGQGPQPCDRTH
jgi:hypothetical protein